MTSIVGSAPHFVWLPEEVRKTYDLKLHILQFDSHDEVKYLNRVLLVSSHLPPA